MGQMIVRKLDDVVIERIKKNGQAGRNLGGTGWPREALTDAFKPSRDEIDCEDGSYSRNVQTDTSGQDIIDEMRRDRDNNLGRPISGP